MSVASGFRFRRLTPAQERAVCRLRQARVPRALIASQYGVSVRTVARAGTRGERPRFAVEVGGYRATFELEDVPVQVTPWVPA